MQVARDGRLIAVSPARRTVRDGNMELFRILAMILTCWLHFFTWGKMNNYPAATRAGFTFRILQAWFSISVNSLISLSGYFGVTSRFNRRRLICLWLQISFYVNFGIQFALYRGKLKWDEGWWFMSRFPILRPAYWFLSSYMQMALAAPALNLAANALTKSQYSVIWIGLLLYEITACRAPVHIFPIHYGYSPLHFMIIYFLAAYFRLHGNPLPGWLTWLIIPFAYWAQYYLLNHKVDGLFSPHLRNFACTLTGEYANYSNLGSILLTFLVMLGFRTFTITGGPGNAVCFVAAHIFAIYLTHQHPAFRSSFYHDWFRITENKGTPDICCRNHIRFVLTTCIASVLFDVYRAKLFALCERLEFAARTAWVSGRELIDWQRRSWTTKMRRPLGHAAVRL
jgi:hypothetical protein